MLLNTAPPHGGIAFSFDRMCAVFNSIDSIRDFAFLRNLGRDVINAPYQNNEQLKELSIQINYSEKDE